jgi:hypothetical protein
MAKNVTQDVQRREPHGESRTSVARDVTSGRFGQGFKKTYSAEDSDRIETERSAMRERLLSND